MLKQLIDKGYIVQQAGSSDRRERLLYPTEKGRALAERLAAPQSVRLAEALKAAGPGAEAVLRRFLEAMVNAEERPKVSSIMAASPVPLKAGGKGEAHDHADADQGASRSSPDDNAPHILVVDDDSRIRDLLARYLQDNGFRVTTAIDAASARATMRSLAFDLLILDVMMPQESGLDFARALRTESHVPILMLTARAEPEQRIEGLETGVDDYLAKPFEPRELLLRVSNILRRGGAAPATGEVRMGEFVFHVARGELQARGRDGPPDRARARAPALFRPAARHAGVAARSWPRAPTAAASARSTCRSTGCGARSSTTLPIRSICRPCAARATVCIPSDGRDRQTPQPLLSRAHPAVPAHAGRVRRPHAEGPLCARADHHHRADRAAAIGGHLRLHGAPLADGDAAAVDRHGAEHRHADRPLPDQSGGRERRDAGRGWPSRISGLRISFAPGEELPPARSKPFFDLLDTTLSDELTRQIGKPFWIDTVGRSNLVEIRIKLDNAVLHVFARRSQTYASNSQIFLLWMVGTSLVLLTVAILFLRNQIKPILRLAEAADSFGKGRPPPDDFRPRGAREVRQAAHAFIEMRDRIERHVEQRTIMLAGVSHDLRTVLTRFKLQLALFEDSPELEAMRADVDEMQAMLEDYMAFAKATPARRSCAPISARS